MDRPSPPWHFLLNPAAGRGKARLRWQRLLPRLQAALPGMSWAESTAGTGMRQLAEAAVRAGHTRLVGVGGDGTHHDVLNGIIDAGALSTVTYAPLPLGSGNDWVRTLRTPRKPDAWLATLRAGKTRAHAVGKLRYTGPEGPRERYFLNVAGMAYDAVVLRRVEASPHKHQLLYPLLTLWFLRDYAAPKVRIDYEGGSYVGAVHTINLGIGRYSGGGMRLVPHAEPTAPHLALTFAERLPLWRIVLESWRFYAGSIGRVRGVTLAHTREARITVLDGTLELEADGEWLGTGSVAVSLPAERLSVIVP